jgi:hypothetical protein
LGKDASSFWLLDLSLDDENNGSICLQPHVRSYLEQRPEKGSNLKKTEVYLCGNINVQSKILLHLMIKPYYKKLFLHQSVNYMAY